MYLAMKWLIFLGFLMWALLCFNDMHLNHIYNKGPSLKPTNNFKEKNIFRNTQRQSMAFLNYLTFIAGALAVTLYNKKSEIFILARKTFIKINLRENLERFWTYLKITATATVTDFSVTMEKTICTCWEKIKNRLSSTKIFFSQVNDDDQRKVRNLLLLRRLREVGLERNRLGQLLVVAVKENKNMRLQYQLENLAKKRLMLQIQETQNQIKESRSKYLHFQQIHLMTHQENLFLKSRVKRLIKDKEEAEANLMKMISRVYQSTDNNLKAYCTCFIVKTKENMLVGDAQASSSLRCLGSGALNSNSTQKKEDEDRIKSLPSTSGTSTSCTSQETILSVVPNESKPRKLKGLPGEYVWTIKDKDGIIEKLYEYDYGYNFDNGDAIRRIREYSVYHESDCLLDIANPRSSTTIIRDRNNPRPATLNVPHRNFLTESPVFQQFLKSRGNYSIARRNSAPPTPPLVFV